MNFFKPAELFPEDKIKEIVDSGDLPEINKLKKQLIQKILRRNKGVPTKLIKSFLNNKNGKKLLDNAFEGLVNQIQQKGQPQKKIPEQFRFCLEREMIEGINSGDKTEAHFIMNFLFEGYLMGILITKDKGLGAREIRQEAYVEAIQRLFSILRGETNQVYRGDASLNTFFGQIFSGKLIDKQRHLNTRKHQILKPQSTSLEEKLSFLGSEAKGILTNEMAQFDHDLTKKIIQWVKTNFEKCYDILILSKGLGYSYREIALKFKSTEGSIRQQASKCLKDIREAYSREFKK